MVYIYGVVFNKKTNRFYSTIGAGGYIRIRCFGKMILLHRLIWLLHYGFFPVKDIDHINGNRSDNRITNLREVTRRENNQNREQHRNGKFIGYTKRGKRYEARIRINGIQTHIGTYDTPEIASAEYKRKYKEVTE